MMPCKSHPLSVVLSKTHYAFHAHTTCAACCRFLPAAPPPGGLLAGALAGAVARVTAALQPLAPATAKFIDELKLVIEANQVGKRVQTERLGCNKGVQGKFIDNLKVVVETN